MCVNLKNNKKKEQRNKKKNHIIMETCRTCAKCDFDNECQWFDLFNAPRWQLETQRIHLELNTWKIKVIIFK